MLNALILVDIQKGFDDPKWGARNNPGAEDRAGDLLQHWRATGQRIVHVQHVSIEEGSPLAGAGTEFKDKVIPLDGEVVFQKSVNSAFIGTGLQAHLENIGATKLTICGLTTPHCVSTTARMAANLGFEVDLVADACAAFAANANTSFDDGRAFSTEDIHRAALAQLHGEFVTVRYTLELLGVVPVANS
ncbi:MAG: cysteine hydrolase family protein [Pseudomonadota bacterium]